MFTFVLFYSSKVKLLMQQTPHLSLESFETQQIIKLRIELAKSKSKLARYEQLISKMGQFGQKLSQLFQQFNCRQQLIGKICQLLQIKGQPLKLGWKEQMNRWENNQSFQYIVLKHEQLLKGSEREEQMLNNIKLSIGQLLKQVKASKQSLKETQREHSGCAGKLSSLQKQLEKMRIMDLELKQREMDTIDLQRKKEELQEKLVQVNHKLEQSELRVRELQTELEEKNKAIVIHQERLQQQEMVTAERENILDRCNSLMQILQVGQEQYLTHYFRSNGLPLQVQRPLKNKYSMVFE